MTATPGFKGFGSTVKWNGTAIGYARDIPFPNMTRDKVDLTNQDSPDESEEFIMGMLHAGEVSFDVIFVPTNAVQVAAITDFLAGTMREMIITGPSSAAYTWTCQAGVIGVGGNQPHKSGEIIANFTLALSGKPVLGVTYAGDLSALTITTATLIPALVASRYEYVATCTGTSVTVTPTYATATSIEVWAGTTFATLALVSVLASGGTSSAIAIAAVGTVAIQIQIKKTGYATRYYNITLTKTA
jgi:hypothetical protein